MLIEAHIVYYEPSCKNRFRIVFVCKCVTVKILLELWKHDNLASMTALVATAINVSYLVTTLYAIESHLLNYACLISLKTSRRAVVKLLSKQFALSCC